MEKSSSIYPTLPNNSDTLAAKLAELKDARDAQLVSHEEYTRLRANILANHSTAPQPTPSSTATTSLLAVAPRFTRKHCCVKFWQVFAFLFAGIAFMLSIASVANPEVAEIWVYCPESPYPTTCDVDCIYTRENYHHHNENEIQKPNTTWCPCGQEYYTVGFHGVEWGNATDPLSNARLQWHDVNDDDDDDNSVVFPLARTNHNFTMDSEIFTNTKHKLIQYRIFTWVLLPIQLFLLLDVAYLMKHSRKAMADPATASAVSRRAVRIPLLMFVTFSLGMTAFVLLANAKLLQSSCQHYGETEPNSLPAYYAQTCTIHPNMAFAGQFISQLSLTFCAAVMLLLSLWITACCCSRPRSYTVTTVPATAPRSYDSVNCDIAGYTAGQQYPTTTDASAMLVPPPYANQPGSKHIV